MNVSVPYELKSNISLYSRKLKKWKKIMSTDYFTKGRINNLALPKSTLTKLLR